MARAGNNHKGGRPPGSVATHTLKAQVAKEKLIELYSNAAEKIHLVILEKALTGDMLAIKELHDRVWGKSFQASEVDVTSKGNPITLTDEQYKQALAAAIKRGGGGESSS